MIPALGSSQQTAGGPGFNSQLSPCLTVFLRSFCSFCSLCFLFALLTPAEEVNAQDLEEQETERNSRGEPGHWLDFQEEEVVRILFELGQDADAEKAGTAKTREATEEERIAFLRKFVAHTSRPASGLTC
jgi:hypothetical protein